jgi:hypothetical protein
MRMVIYWMVKNFQDIIIVRLVNLNYMNVELTNAKTNYQDIMSRKSSVNKIKER